MYELTEKFQGNDVFVVTIDDEPDKTKHWFRATQVCKVLEFSNTKETLETHCKPWQYREFKVGNGRPALYVCLSGLFRLTLRSKSVVGVEFQDWVSEDILPKLFASGYYVMPTATSEQLEAAQKEIKELQVERGYLLEWSPRMSIQKMRFLELINFKAEEYSPFFLDAHDKHRFVDSYYWQKLQKYQKGATIMFALIDTLLEPGKKVSVSTFGCKTVSALMAKVPYKFYRVLTIPCQGIYQKLNPNYQHLEKSVELKEKYGEVWLEYLPEKRKELKKFLNEYLVA